MGSGIGLKIGGEFIQVRVRVKGTILKRPDGKIPTYYTLKILGYVAAQDLLIV